MTAKKRAVPVITLEMPGKKTKVEASAVPTADRAT